MIWKYSLQKAIERRIDHGHRSGAARFPLGRRMPVLRRALRPAVPGDGAHRRGRRASTSRQSYPHPHLRSPSGGPGFVRTRGRRFAPSETWARRFSTPTAIATPTSWPPTWPGKCLQTFRNSGEAGHPSAWAGTGASAPPPIRDGASSGTTGKFSPRNLLLLRRGGKPESRGVVDALVFQSGRIWAPQRAPLGEGLFSTRTSPPPSRREFSPPLVVFNGHRASAGPAGSPCSTLPTPAVKAGSPGRHREDLG